MSTRSSVRNRHLQAKADLARYYELLDKTLNTMVFTAMEADDIYAACQFVNFNKLEVIALLWALLDSYAHQEGKDLSTLVDKLKSLSLAQKTAIVDQVERHWYARSEGT